MSRYGWAYVNSIVTGAAVIGPDRGVVLNEGGYASASTNFQFSGSTGSINGQLNVTGNVIVSGTLYATEYHTTTITSSIIYTSGSTKFGDDAGDTHIFTGSILASGTAHIITGSLNLTGTTHAIYGNLGNITTGDISSKEVSCTTLQASKDVTLGDSILDVITINGVAYGTTASFTEVTASSASVGVLLASANSSFGKDLTILGDLYSNGNTILGNVSTDIITVNGQITGSRFDINGGTIDGTTIGASVQSSGRFTTLSASSTLNIVGISTLQTVTASAVSSSGVLNVNGITTLTTLTASNGARFTGGKKVELTDPAGTNVKISLDGNVGEISGSSNFTVGGQLAVQGQATFNAGATGSAFDINGGTIDNTSIGATTQSTGKFTTLSASSNLQVGGDITGSNLLVNGIFGEARSKTFTLVTPGTTNVDTTTDSDFILLYSTSTSAGTVTLHNPAQSGKVLIIRKTSNVNNITLTCSVGGALFDKDNTNTAGTGIVITAGTETNKMFASSGTNWYEIFAGG